MTRNSPPSLLHGLLTAACTYDPGPEVSNDGQQIINIENCSTGDVLLKTDQGWTCEPQAEGVSTVTPGDGIKVEDGQVSLQDQGCPPGGQWSRAESGDGWVCVEDSIKTEGDVDEASTLQFRVIIEKGAEIRKSVIRGPAVIGAGTVIRNAYVGPFTSIDSNCRVEDVEIQHSIVCQNSVISDDPSQGTFRIEDSLIGTNVQITRTTLKPKAHRLLLGDSSKVELP